MSLAGQKRSPRANAAVRYGTLVVLAIAVGGLTLGLARIFGHVDGGIAAAGAVLVAVAVLGSGFVLAEGFKAARGNIGKGLLVSEHR